MKVNLHTHTCCCRHGSGNIADYMVWAEREKFDVLGFSEHVPLPGGLLKTTRIPLETLPYFWKEFDEAAQKYPQIKLLRALEGEYIPELMNFQKELKEIWHLDYMIASNHYIWLNGNKESFPGESNPAALKIITEQSIKLMESGLAFSLPILIFTLPTAVPGRPTARRRQRISSKPPRLFMCPLRSTPTGSANSPSPPLTVR